ncbi:glycosyltransferase [Actinoplanes sp. NPDC048796]|uniref:glycosyltransferase n=1 Tax=Actinoplanes sp. NPDC048796 TaxID=3155640 RepID=UPI0033CB1AE6
MTASIVIPTHTERRWDSLRRTVDSALAQAMRPAEVIVVVDHHAARRTLPRAVARDLVAATIGHGGYHALRAATVVAAVVAAGFGGGVETLAQTPSRG